MAARSTMAWILIHLRMEAHDEDSEVWADDKLQRILDLHCRYVSREKLSKDPTERVFRSQYRFMEGATTSSAVSSGTTEWTGAGDANECINIWDGADDGASAVTPDNFNLMQGVFRWDADQEGDVYYLDAYSYDIHAVLADCMRQLAKDPHKAKRWDRGGVSYTHYDYTEMAKDHDKRSGAVSGRLVI